MNRETNTKSLECYGHILADIALVDYDKLQTGCLTDDEWTRLGNAAGLLSQSKEK